MKKERKKFILFRFFQHYPIGGLADITNESDNLDELIKEVTDDGLYDYNEIVDRDTWEIVWKKNPAKK